MREAKWTIHVWNKDTKWGDSMYFYCEAAHWKRTCKLTTSAESFPWWKGEVVINLESFTKGVMECKLAVWRDNHYEVWEPFKGNREMEVEAGTKDVYVKFGEECWLCPVCYTAIDEDPILCAQQHPQHKECFELYVNDELTKKNTALQCMECKHDIPDTWQEKVSGSILKRYERVCAIKTGHTVVTCPMATCNFEIVYGPDDLSKPDNEVCGSCGVIWCVKCEKLGTLVDGECTVCAKGLKGIADLIYDALEEASGTKCPSCFQRGQKLPSECTHISCDCGEVFCYCCGLPGAEVDSTDPHAETDLDRLYGHNDDFYCNNERCPMWLINYVDMISDWPQDVDDAQENFHSMRANKKLKEIKGRVCQYEWDRFLDTDNNVKVLVEEYLSKTFTIS